jgi:hypothetical protein
LRLVLLSYQPKTSTDFHFLLGACHSCRLPLAAFVDFGGSSSLSRLLFSPVVQQCIFILSWLTPMNIPVQLLEIGHFMWTMSHFSGYCRTREDDQMRERFAKGSRKVAVARKIHFQGRLYPILYQLASLVLDKVQANPELFPWLPTSKNNKTKTIHAIGKIIAAKRYSQARFDIDRLPSGEVEPMLQSTLRVKICLSSLREKSLVLAICIMVKCLNPKRLLLTTKFAL